MVYWFAFKPEAIWVLAVTSWTVCYQGSMDAGNSGARADSGSAGAAGKPEDNQALTEEALHLKRIQVCCSFTRPV